MDIRDKLIKIIAEELGVEECRISDEADFVDDLDAEPYQVTGILSTVVTNYNITIPEEEHYIVTNLRTLFECVNELIE